MESYYELADKINYKFNNISLLKTALTHSSYANEAKQKTQNNERLEFLGDAVLSLIVSDYLYKTFRHMPEGELSKIRAKLVCEKCLHKYSKVLGLDKYLLLGKGEESTGGRQRPSVCADAFEAVIASIYLDSGKIKPAKDFVMPFVLDELKSEKEFTFNDYKTKLQEIIQQNKEEILTYVLVDEKGPDHDKQFIVEVHLNSNVIGNGKGGSKKEAEQMAAKEALELLGQ